MSEQQKIKPRLYDIHCPSCGAPAYYDIKAHIYNCRYCGGKVKIDRAIADHKGFRELQKRRMNKDLKNFSFQKAECTGCGAKLVFDEGNALANCTFCGRSLVRKAFVNADTIPELIIPFTITPEEAKDFLISWCKENSGKREAKALLKKADDLQGCYLPYELVRGPVNCKVSRIENGRVYECGGFVDQVFINCSKMLDNELLDGMEPYDLDEITEFDFSLVAGHQVKVGDISDEALSYRIAGEVGASYRPVIQKTLETKAVYVNADPSGVLEMPVLLPVYYLAFDGYMAAVNGQTGKVSVRAVKESHYIILPWWLKAIKWAIISICGIMLGMFLCGAENDLVLEVGVLVGPILLIVLLVAYSENMDHDCWIEADRKIFTSKGARFERKHGKLIQTGGEPVRPETKPLFFMNIQGRREVVELKFTSFLRVLRTIAVTLGVLFFPVIIALFVNGFNFSLIKLGGSAVWFCIVVPLTPIFLVKFGRIDLYDNPWIYIVGENGKKRRFKQKIDWGFTRHDVLKALPTLLFKPPGCFLTWFIIMCFIAMINLTAFGDW